MNFAAFKSIKLSKTWLVLIVAVVIGAIAAFAASSFLSGRLADIEARSQGETVNIVVATRFREVTVTAANTDPFIRQRIWTSTTDGTTGQIQTQPNSRIGAYSSAVAGGVMAAASTSEVFFERPVTQVDNVFGTPLGRPRELGSLFNPYWQVRLVSTNAVGEWLRQGVTP